MTVVQFPFHLASRDDAARYLTRVGHPKLEPAEFLVSHDTVRMVRDETLALHRECECEFARRVNLAAAILCDELPLGGAL